jgi:hypothetical protein
MEGRRVADAEMRGERRIGYVRAALGAFAAVVRGVSVTLAACLMIGGDLTYRSSAQPSPAAATVRGGPQPSNTAVRWLIQAKYRHDAVVEGSRIGVQVDNGVVTLTGHARDESARVRALQLANQVRGVNMVHDRLEVRYAPPQRTE